MTLRLCPICNVPLSLEAEAMRFRPFCSRRCADVDLGRWLMGTYAIPAAGLDDEAEAEPSGRESGIEPEDDPAGGQRARVRH